MLLGTEPGLVVFLMAGVRFSQRCFITLNNQN